MPVVAATIVKSELDDYHDVDGKRIYIAKVHFSYSFRGNEYVSETPALRGAQMFPLYNYEAKLLKKYQLGEMFNARVVPNVPEYAYLEIAPLSKASTILLPLTIVGYALYLVGLGWYTTFTIDVFSNPVVDVPSNS